MNRGRDRLRAFANLEQRAEAVVGRRRTVLLVPELMLAADASVTGAAVGVAFGKPARYAALSIGVLADTALATCVGAAGVSPTEAIAICVAGELAAAA